MGPMGSLGLPPSQGGPIVRAETQAGAWRWRCQDAFGLRLVVPRGAQDRKWTIRNWTSQGGTDPQPHLVPHPNEESEDLGQV